MMVKKCLTWTKLHGSLVTNNCVRYARKNVKTGLPGHEFILAKETSAMFGPARNSDGALNYVESRQPLTKEKTPPPLAYDIQNVRNLSTIRELDSILTFPMRKTIDEARELSLISDGIQAEIPILTSDAVTTLDRKTSLPSVSKILDTTQHSFFHCEHLLPWYLKCN